jgi:hypothetical protein
MSNVSSSWFNYGPVNIELLRTLILTARESEIQKTYAKAAEWHPTELSKWLTQGSPIPNHERYLRLLHCLAGQGRIQPEQYDLAFEGISNFLQYNIDLLIDRRAEFEGHYAVYRWSMLAPRHILRGSLHIYYDAAIKALRTAEDYRIQAEVYSEPGSANHPDDAPSGGRGFKFPRAGYFFARGDNSYVLISKKPSPSPTQIQTIFFDNSSDDNENSEQRTIGMMYGQLSDWHDKRFYVTRVMALKRGDALKPEDIKALEPTNVNQTIRVYLTRTLHLEHKFLVEF